MYTKKNIKLLITSKFLCLFTFAISTSSTSNIHGQGDNDLSNNPLLSTNSSEPSNGFYKLEGLDEISEEYLSNASFFTSGNKEHLETDQTIAASGLTTNDAHIYTRAMFLKDVQEFCDMNQSIVPFANFLKNQLLLSVENFYLRVIKTEKRFKIGFFYPFSPDFKDLKEYLKVMEEFINRNSNRPTCPSFLFTRSFKNFIGEVEIYHKDLINTMIQFLEFMSVRIDENNTGETSGFKRFYKVMIELLDQVAEDLENPDLNDHYSGYTVVLSKLISNSNNGTFLDAKTFYDE